MVYAPVAHRIWHPGGLLAQMSHMDFAGGTVVHIASGVSGLVAAKVLGSRLGFGREPMVPHNPLITVFGAGLRRRCRRAPTRAKTNCARVLKK